jgi:cytochrome P450
MATKLQEFLAQGNPALQNQLLFGWLQDHTHRAGLYDELRTAGFPVLRFKSVMRAGGQPAGAWPTEDVYLISGQSQVEQALKLDSVAPYQALESGGRFMLALDEQKAHDTQRKAAMKALKFTADELAAVIEEACDRAMVVPRKNRVFDLVATQPPVPGRDPDPDVAERSVLRFLALLFGLPVEAYFPLRAILRGAYTKLTFQIIGRHFVADSGLPPAGSAQVEELKVELRKHILDARNREAEPDVDGKPKRPRETVIKRLFDEFKGDADEAVLVAIGLMAGTIGNVRAAVAIAIEHLLNDPDSRIDAARQAARAMDQARRAHDQPAQAAAFAALQALVIELLLKDPPAPFLARTCAQPRDAVDVTGRRFTLPKDANLLLAIGPQADESLLFGGPATDDYMHRCIGEHLARPLVVEIVQRVLLLPGLSQKVDADGQPVRLKRQWAASAESYPLQFQRDRLMNQQPLFVVLPIKRPYKENAQALVRLTSGGAHIVEEALRASTHVHFAWFTLVENGTHLAMCTVFDGDIDAYVEHFASKVSLFDQQFEFLDCNQPTPISQYPKEFVETIKKFNRAPLGNYFFSAYPKASVVDVLNGTEGLL